MLRYLVSHTFWITLLLVVTLVHYIGWSDLANYVQVSGVFGWSFVIWHLIRTHKLVKTLIDDKDDDKL